MELWVEPPQWISLPQGRLLWWPDAFQPEADAWFGQLQAEIPWQQHRLTLFGREHDEPRLSCWMGEAAYRYSGKTREPEAWHPLVNEIRQQVQGICEQPFNGVLLNLYRHGRDSMGWHADNEPELGPNPVIASVSLGATRRFLLHHRNGERRQLQLSHGSLLVMAGEMQHHWQHALPRIGAADTARINLTFRYLV
ncbi:alpha-ketoglutarate-dependent dioxygenase AlkB family protein [Oceanisphaera arctica]|uniref:Alpha-ketoglutarate-dependent dioxygenase AlkB n=1 Tax=Oceanisphaera arctica TaxID=641510 RepID=A0A2P5TLG5_9GAMM|nr:alpha-ketoglutarate-dependent dioxygenase AlkB [Oceanisphaera arctica]PPL16079.1 alpha-ketoglutarate-dependent dioxygenase AlkB [Oceanisphaera arctica]GHA26515.1 alkylated DNA repair protein [Oceanisphaera arctica]